MDEKNYIIDLKNVSKIFDGVTVVDRNNSALVDHNRHQVLFTVGCRF